MVRLMPYAVACGGVALVGIFFSQWIFYIAGGICAVYFLWYFAFSKD